MKPRRVQRAQPVKPKKQLTRKVAVIVVIAVLLVGGAVYARHDSKSKATASTTIPAVSSQTNTALANPTDTAKAEAAAEAAADSMCSGNTLSELILVSISKQHLWACDGTTSEYDSAVVTGMELYPADLTPTGTFHIYAKETNQVLNGHDSTGSWSDPVSYWMPFLDNQYGEYGLHDATWRSASDFGNININSPYTAAEHGSHGCVELPLATAKWLYGWAPIGTTVTIQS
jgi:lipoprotein-anchoring transpeptidase ErfK/SrfK